MVHHYQKLKFWCWLDRMTIYRCCQRLQFSFISVCNSPSCEEKQQQQKLHAFSWSMNCRTMTTKHLLCWPNCLIHFCLKIHCKQLALHVYRQMPCIVFCIDPRLLNTKQTFQHLPWNTCPSVAGKCGKLSKTTNLCGYIWHMLIIFCSRTAVRFKTKNPAGL